VKGKKLREKKWENGKSGITWHWVLRPSQIGCLPQKGCLIDFKKKYLLFDTDYNLLWRLIQKATRDSFLN
jgi:hypothetical protein